MLGDERMDQNVCVGMMAVMVVSHSQANTLTGVARYMYVDSAGVVCGNSKAVEGGPPRKS